jgi:CheY-like chemotaxis protein
MHKILIVDDDKAMCDLLRACLSEGYEVIDTVGPEQALGLAVSRADSRPVRPEKRASKAYNIKQHQEWSVSTDPPTGVWRRTVVEPKWLDVAGIRSCNRISSETFAA